MKDIKKVIESYSTPVLAIGILFFMVMTLIFLIVLGVYLFFPQELPYEFQRAILSFQSSRLQKGMSKEKATALFHIFTSDAPDAYVIEEHLTACQGSKRDSIWYYKVESEFRPYQISQVDISFLKDKVVCWEYAPDDLPFTSEDWKKASKLRRAGMANSLISKAEQFVGLTRSEVKKRLGQPDNITDDSQEKEWDYYFFGAMDARRFVVRFDQHDTVTEAGEGYGP